MTDHQHVGYSLHDDPPVLVSHLERDHGITVNVKDHQSPVELHDRLHRRDHGMNDESFTFRGVEIGEGAVYKVVTTVPVSAEWLADVESVRSSMDQAFGRRSHPWDFADGNPFPHIDPVPWFTSAIDRAKAVRQRIRDVWSVARHGLPHQ